jgi:NlpC/P60 family
MATPPKQGASTRGFEVSPCVIVFPHISSCWSCCSSCRRPRRPRRTAPTPERRRRSPSRCSRPPGKSGRHRSPLPRDPLQLGRSQPGRLRLLRLRHVRLQEARNRTPPLDLDALERRPPVDGRHLQAGDIVFFNGESHVGIYIGQGRFVHSPHTGDVVKISSFPEDWYGSTFDGARRVD